MLTLQMPMLLALFGTALMAVVIFAPQRLAHAARVTASCAPPASPSVIERWYPARQDYGDGPIVANGRTPAWPELVDPRAAECDAGARLALADALAIVRAPWSEAILRTALEDEPDPAVRAVLVEALAATA